MTLGSASVIRGNARALPLADNSVDLVVTSPPYFALRSYQDGGEHYAGQIGDEPTPAEFVASLLEVTRECVRVLKPSGSLWVNLGDKYASGGRSTYDLDPGRREVAATRAQDGFRAKTLLGIPWRYALACIDDLGLILRAEVIWSKPNGLPESVTDRVRRSHEQWFHFTREPRYFSAVDEIREATSPRKGEMTWAERKAAGEPARRGEQGANDATVNGMSANPLGKLPGSVWTIPTEPLRVPDHLGIDHFAAFPTEWPKRIIQGWSPQGVCVECGEGRRPTMHTERPEQSNMQRNLAAILLDRGQRRQGHSSTSGIPASQVHREITGYVCACPEPTADTRPAIVLDPFGGTGTTAMVAKALGRHGITVDMSADYCRLAEWRTNDRDQLAKVLGIAKTTTPPDVDQLDLFTEETA
jgi:DNA modification methylase